MQLYNISKNLNRKIMNILTKTVYSFAKIGFIGLGSMGFPMAINLAKKGHQVYGFAIDQSKAAEAHKNNITFRNEIKQVAKDAQIFVSIVPKCQDSIQVCQSEGGLFKNAAPGSIIIDCSTISYNVSMALNKNAKNYNMTYIDAPVSGGYVGAIAGTLTFMVGAENDQIFNSIKPILQAMGLNLFNCGKIGAGGIAKTCNNMAVGIHMIGICETLALGKTLGMDLNILTNIMKVSSSRCWILDTYNPAPGVIENLPASRNYERGFACDLMAKDLRLATKVAKQVNTKVELGDKSMQIYQKISKMGYGRKDIGVIYDLLFNKKC